MGASRGVEAQADEAALSRIFGSIHYRFDCDAGLVLGRTIAAYVLSHDVVGHQPFVLNWEAVGRTDRKLNPFMTLSPRGKNAP